MEAVFRIFVLYHIYLGDLRMKDCDRCAILVHNKIHAFRCRFKTHHERRLGWLYRLFRLGLSDEDYLFLYLDSVLIRLSAGDGKIVSIFFDKTSKVETEVFDDVVGCSRNNSDILDSLIPAIKDGLKRDICTHDSFLRNGNLDYCILSCEIFDNACRSEIKIRIA